MPDIDIQNQRHNELILSTSQVQRIKRILDATVQMAQLPNLQLLNKAIVELVSEITDNKRILLFVLDDEEAELKLGYTNTIASEADSERLQKVYVSVFNMADDPIFSLWLENKSFVHTTSTPKPLSPLSQIIEIAGFNQFYTVPIIGENRVIAAIIIEMDDEVGIAPEDEEILRLFTNSAAVILQNTRLHTRTVEKLASSMHEMSIFQQIDRELNETIELPTVFTLMLDWALRFTNASAATIALYDEETDVLRTRLNYGYEQTDEALEQLRGEHDSSIAHRVARSSRVEVVPDTLTDNDYTWVANGIQSQMAVPVMREDKVIAVITLESRKINAFTDDHVSFAQQLANRAAVAIDNARLYEETVREREKLSYILGRIADVVMVIDQDERIVIISQSAISALNLYPDKKYDGQIFANVINFTPIVEIYRRALKQEEGIDEELTLPNGRTYFTKADYYTGIGLIMVLQDITPFKETDRLKNELVATVSHDLKQPLGVMRGYLDLLQMTNTFNEKSMGFVNMIDRAITSMRQLIDDLLDLARIESGLDLNLEPISLNNLLRDCIEYSRPAAMAKQMVVTDSVPEKTTIVFGERTRLEQIFNNLIGNAIKYSPPEGNIWVEVEDRGATARIGIRDDGIGISPEDQAHIFERFYRVRRPETESIEGTGLGLAIVRTLIEAHHGKIRLESRLGEGSTFFVTLPVQDI